MMRTFLSVLLALSVLTTSAFAAEKKADAPPPAGKRERKASFSSRSSRSSATPLQVGNSLLGARIGGFGAFMGRISFGVSYEYIFHKEFGINPQLYYASYGQTYSAGTTVVDYSLKATTLVVTGTYHAPFIKVPNLDVYGAAGIAYSSISSSASSNVAPANFSVDSSGAYLVASVNGRYFFQENLAAVGTLGLGLSNVIVGLDYMF